MRNLPVVVILLCLCVSWSLAGSLSWRPPDNDSTCKFTRSDALACALKYGDIDNDGKLSKPEVERLFKKLIPDYLKLPAWLEGDGADRTMKDCDYNQDGVLTPRDWELSVKTCMPKQKDLCKFKWFCDRQEQ